MTSSLKLHQMIIVIIIIFETYFKWKQKLQSVSTDDLIIQLSSVTDSSLSLFLSKVIY